MRKNRTAAFFCTLGGEPATYPVPYRRFVPGGAFEGLRAVPSAPDDPTSNWALYAEHESTGPATAVTRTYRARTGVFTGGANAVFYLRVLDEEAAAAGRERHRPGQGEGRARGGAARARLAVPARQGPGPGPVDRRPAPWQRHRRAAHRGNEDAPGAAGHAGRTAPRTLAYLARHEALLRVRPSLTGMDKASVAEGFYALLRVGDYTFAPYKVAWKYISRTFCCAVVGPSPLAGVAAAHGASGEADLDRVRRRGRGPLRLRLPEHDLPCAGTWSAASWHPGVGARHRGHPHPPARPRRPASTGQLAARCAGTGTRTGPDPRPAGPAGRAARGRWPPG